MAYSTKSDIIDMYGNEFLLSVADVDADGALSAAEDTSITKAIAWADSRINSYVRVRYPAVVPLTGSSITDAIVAASVDLAVYRLARDAGLMSDSIKERFEEQKGWLKDIASGMASLGEEGTLKTQGGVQMFDNARVFTKDTWEDL